MMAPILLTLLRMLKGFRSAARVAAARPTLSSVRLQRAVAAWARNGKWPDPGQRGRQRLRRSPSRDTLTAGARELGVASAVLHRGPGALGRWLDAAPTARASELRQRRRRASPRQPACHAIQSNGQRMLWLLLVTLLWMVYGFWATVYVPSYLTTRTPRPVESGYVIAAIMQALNMGGQLLFADLADRRARSAEAAGRANGEAFQLA